MITNIQRIYFNKHKKKTTTKRHTKYNIIIMQLLSLAYFMAAIFTCMRFTVALVAWFPLLLSCAIKYLH